MRFAHFLGNKQDELLAVLDQGYLHLAQDLDALRQRPFRPGWLGRACPADGRLHFLFLVNGN